jgi:hypothetical protein
MPRESAFDDQLRANKVTCAIGRKVLDSGRDVLGSAHAAERDTGCGGLLT